MRPARAAEPAGMRRSRARGRRLAGPAVRGKDGKLLRQFGGTAVRARRSCPVSRTDQHFAVLVTVRAMKFVNRHARSITTKPEISRFSFESSKHLQRPAAAIATKTLRYGELVVTARTIS